MAITTSLLTYIKKNIVSQVVSVTYLLLDINGNNNGACGHDHIDYNDELSPCFLDKGQHAVV